MANSELQTVNMSNFRALKAEDQDEIRAVVEENLAGADFRPEIIKTPSGESLLYQIESDRGPVGVQEIEGVILFQGQKRARFAGQYDGKVNRQPLCRSSDMIRGEGDPGGECKTCPHAKYEGDCKPKMELLLLREQDVFPVLVRVPLSALGAMHDYLSFLTRRGLRRSAVVTRLGLVSAQITKGPHMGKKYAKMHPELAGPLSPEDRKRVALYTESIKALIDRMGVAGLYDEVEEGTPVQTRVGYKAEDENQSDGQTVGQSDMPADADWRMPQHEERSDSQNGQGAKISLKQWQALKGELLTAGVKVDDFADFIKEFYHVTQSSQIGVAMLPELREALSQGYIVDWIQERKEAEEHATALEEEREDA